MKLFLTKNLTEKFNLLPSEAKHDFELFLRQTGTPHVLDRMFENSRRLHDDIFVIPLGRAYRLFYTEETKPGGEKVILLLDIIHREDPKYVDSIRELKAGSHMTNTEYEQYVRNIVEALLHAQGLETVEVKHDVQIQGLSRSHQIDVYWEYRMGGVSHRVIINCKRYKNTVEVTDVLTLSGVLADMPGVRGLIVSTVGFQKGAVDYAKTHQIGLKIIRPPEDGDWKGRIREIQLSVKVASPELLSCDVQIDRAWAEANVTRDPDSLAGTSTNDARTTQVRDLKSDTISDMNELWQRAMQENPTKVGEEGCGTLKWEDARLERPGQPSLRISSITFRWKIIQEKDPLFIRHRSEPAAIVRDAIAGTLLFVDPDGAVTGDTKEELGQKK